MSYRALRAAAPIVLILGSLGSLLVMGRPQQTTRAKPSSFATARPAHTRPMKLYEGTLDLATDGVVQPRREVVVASEVAGRVCYKSHQCEPGRFVSRGTLLFEIDPTDYELERRQSQEQCRDAEISLQEHELELAHTSQLLELAQRELQLEREQWKRIAGLSDLSAVSESERDRVQRTILAAEKAELILEHQLKGGEARRNRLQGALDLARARLARAECDVLRTRIVAPIDGIIVQDPLEQESYVQKGATALVLDDTASVEVRCSLQLDDLCWLCGQSEPAQRPADALVGFAARFPPTPATVIAEVPGLPRLRFSWKGTLAQFDGSGLDERTRSIACRVTVERPDQVAVSSDDGRADIAPVGPPALLRGMYVGVVLHIQPRVPLAVVPETALLPGKRVQCFRGGRMESLGPLAMMELSGSLVSEAEPQRYWVTPVDGGGLQVGDEFVVRTPRDAHRSPRPDSKTASFAVN